MTTLYLFHPWIEASETGDTVLSLFGQWWDGDAAATAAITGTATASIDEDDVVTGGKTIIITLTNDTFIAAGTGPIGSTANTQALIDGISAATSPTNGWNNEWRDKEATTAVVRTSNTVATITMSSQATISGSYDIASQETITVTVPAAVLTGGSPIVATPTFTVDPVVAAILIGIIGAGVGSGAYIIG